MFSQRNNPYCELLSVSKVKNKFVRSLWETVIFVENFFLNLRVSFKLIAMTKNILGLDLKNKFKSILPDCSKRGIEIFRKIN